MSGLRFGITVLFALQVIPATAAGYKTGDDLLGDCTSHTSMELGQCYGYIEGVKSIQDMMREASHLQSCIPNGTEAADIVDTVVAYLQNDSSIRDNDAGPLVLAAITKKWGCKP